MQGAARNLAFRHRHLLGIEGLSPDDINQFLDVADGYVELNRQAEKKRSLLRGRTARHTCFCGLLRSRTIDCKRSRSAGVTSMVIPLRMPNNRTSPAAGHEIRTLLLGSIH